MSRKAIVNIFSSYNNILMTATDLTGAETITTCNGGEVVKAGKDKGGQFAATRAALDDNGRPLRAISRSHDVPRDSNVTLNVAAPRK